MRRAITIRDELDQIRTVEELTGVFESVASIKIARIRNRVIASKEYFAELWQTYRGLRIDPKEQLKRTSKKRNNKNVLVAVTAEGKLGGEIGNKVIEEVVRAHAETRNTDVIVLGAHGAEQLAHRGVQVAQTFHLPVSDTQFDVTDMIAVLDEYEQISVFYQTYESLRVQRVARIELVSAVRELSDEINQAEQEADVELLTSHEYIFEPGITEIADYLETLMMGVALTQVLMESKLAQHASRFNAMHAAKQKAVEMGGEYSLQFHRAKRAEGDERLKEIMKVFKELTA